MNTEEKPSSPSQPQPRPTSTPDRPQPSTTEGRPEVRV